MKAHFGTAGSILLFFACLTLSVSGVRIITTPTPRPVLLGWLHLIGAVAVAVLTAKLWRRVWPGVFACASLNCVYMALTGHEIGQDESVQRAKPGV